MSDRARREISGAVTLKDVAAVAGVSVSTVSRVLNNTGRVSEETRRRITGEAQRLGFEHNALARSFATGRSLTIGILAWDSLSTFAMPVLVGASDALGSADLATLTYSLRAGDRDYVSRLAKFHSRRIDGLLVIGEGLGYRLPPVVPRGPVPVVYVFARPDDDHSTSFVPDGRGAGRLAAEYLLAQGRRRLVHITATSDFAAEERAAGFLGALRDAGVSPATPDPLRGEWTQLWGYRAAGRLLDEGREIDGYFCGDDWIAFGVQAALRDRGVRVPEDVTVIGYDNIGGLVDRPARTITTIDPRLADLGAAAAIHLVDVLRGGDLRPGVQLQECSLVPAPGPGSSEVRRDPDEAGGLAAV